jgi:hypothetical protein
LSYELSQDDGQGGNFEVLLGGDNMTDSLATEHTIGVNISEGVLYRFRWRARNVNGWSGYSPIAYVRAATRPARPLAPLLSLASATGITVSMQRSASDGGGATLVYELWRNQGTSTVDFVKVTSYDGLSTTHLVPVEAGGLVAGQIYAFKTVAVNEFGSSEASEELYAGVAEYPAAPVTLTKVLAESGPTYITLEWAQSADTELVVLGYLLLMKDNSLGTDEFNVIYNGTNFPNVRKFTVASGIQTGIQYTFKVQAVNFNGAGPSSSEITHTICNAPTDLAAPTLAAVSRTTMTLAWLPPTSDGGCQILSYSIFRDAGTGGAVDVEVDASAVNNKPTLRNHQITSFTASDTGTSYQFKIRATNVIGNIESIEVAHVLAAVPDTPASSPTLNQAGTS